MEKENKETCKRIALTLDRIAWGEVFTCPHCGEMLAGPYCGGRIDGAEPFGGAVAHYDSENDVYTCKACGAKFDADDAEPVSMWDYFNDVYNVEYRIDGNKEYKSVELMIACGGPNIYVDTGSGCVELYWWGHNAAYQISDDARAQIDEMGEMMYTC